MSLSKKLVEEDSSWRQRSELEAMADLPPELEKELERLDKEFAVSREKLKKIVQRFKQELEEGLQENGKNIPMNVTWVHNLPSGNEKGTFLTLDLGGTNLRICKVALHGNDPNPATRAKKSSLEQEQYKLPEKIKTSTASDLWTHIASKLQVFLSSTGLDKQYSKERPMPLGFTFSYPASQERIDHAVLQTWTKGFDIEGVEGQDVAAQLRKAMVERELPLELVCVVNDTVGAMVASAYNDAKTIIGAVFGTGCNAAYMSSLASIKKLFPSTTSSTTSTGGDEGSGGGDSSTGEKMAINCEYGAFDNAHAILPLTPYDVQIDKESPRPGEQTFEKLSAGLYLGEIFRLVLLELAERHLIFPSQGQSRSQSQGQDFAKLRDPYSIDTSFLSQIEDDETPAFTATRDIFRDTLGLDISDAEIELSRRLAELIAVRGARLCACGVAAICQLEGISEGHVAADGSVANKHPKFKRRWARALGEILDWDEEGRREGEGEDPIVITSAEDGSGVGCAIIAAMEMERRGRRV